MKNILLICLLILILPTASWAVDSPLNDNQKLGYALGLDIGASLKRMNPPIDFEMLQKGVRDYFIGNKPLLLSPDEAYLVKMSYAKEHKTRDSTAQEHRTRGNNLLEWREKTAKKNAIKAMRFFKGNQRTLGVNETDSGLQYMVIKSGVGPKPSLDEFVSIRYRAMHLDGKVFDGIEKDGSFTMFLAGKALKGWQEALTMMKVGSTFRLFVPAKLTYGENGSGTLVEPGEALIFELELVGIVDEKTYKNSVYYKHKIPPYTAPGQADIVISRQIIKQSLIGKSDLDLHSLLGAAQTFMGLRNNIMPVYNVENINEICVAVATAEFQRGCGVLLMERVNWLNSMGGLRGAEFPDGKMDLPLGVKNAVDVQWKEVLRFKDNKSQTNSLKIRLGFENDKGVWRLSSVKDI